MWSDNETSIDFLNYTEVAELICEMVTDRSLMPLSLGIYGGWGVGKSSVLKLVESTLAERNDTIVIEFDAWLYQGFDEAKTAMMTVIASELHRTAPEGLKEKAWDLIGRVDKLRALSLGTEIGLTAFGVPTFGLLTKAVGAAQNAISGSIDESDVEALKEGAKTVKEKAGGLIRPKATKTAPEEITAFKREYSEVLGASGKQLVVFIDNLDRCLPENAIRSLEAMRLFLSMPNTAFIVAADVDMIRHAVSTHFKGASERHVLDYLDKMIQFPISVPRLGLREVTSFLCMLIATRSNADPRNVENLRAYFVEQIQTSWKDDSELKRENVVKLLGPDATIAAQIDTAFRIAPMLTRSRAVSGNPRLIKRMMNVIRMRHTTATRRKMNLDESVITKLALFERCTDEAAFRSLLDVINAASNGKSRLFDLDHQHAFKRPETWEKHSVFIDEWLQLEPTLKNVDLRPAVYLARETLPLQLNSKALSPQSQKALLELLKIPSLTSKAGPAVARTILLEERTEVMTAVIAVLRQDSDWKKKRGDITGAIILATEAPETAKLLTAFLDQLVPMPPWLKVMTKELYK